MSHPEPVQNLLDRLEGVKAAGPGKWSAKCPAHDDAHASLSIGTGDDGRALVKCQAGCDAADVVKAVDLSLSDLFAGNGKPVSRPTAKALTSTKAKAKGKGRMVTTYPYRDAAGELLYEVARFDPKDFSQRRPDGKGRWIWNLDDVPRVLYRLPELLAVDPAPWVFIVEGEKDVDTLRAIGLVATCNPGGAGKWGKLADDRALHGRRVAIIPDRDKPGLAHAQDVASRLHRKAAMVKIIDLPDMPPQDDGRPRKDASDWIEWLDGRTAEELAAAMVGMAEAAPEWTPPPAGTPAEVEDESEDDESDAGLGSTKWIADAIQTVLHFARDGGGKLYVFIEGVYKAGGEKAIRKAVKRLLEDWGLSEKWSTHKAEEVVQYIAVDVPELWPQPPLDKLNLANGLLNITTGELSPHDPAFLSPVQLSVSLDPAATCPAWDKFITETFPQDAQAIAWQIPAWLMLPYTAIQKAVLLLGEGANGKSTYLAALVAFIGKGNISALSLHKLEGDKFSASRLVGKLANVCPDLPSAHLAGTSIFKALVGNDMLLGERKYADSFEFSPFARLIFSANHPPRSADASHAFFRRWIVVPFGRTFEQSQQTPRNVLDARLADPKELSGALNKALAALPELYAKGFIESQSMRDAWNEFRETTDPLAVWLDTHTQEGPALLVAKAELLRAYNTDARHNQRPDFTAKGFGLALKRLRPKIEEAQRTVANGVAWCWLGIGLKTDDTDSLV